MDYAFLLSPPATPASYMHLAGRTARRGRRGTAVTLVTHEQAPRLVGFAQALGIAFEPTARGSPRGAEGGAEAADAPRAQTTC